MSSKLDSKSCQKGQRIDSCYSMDKYMNSQYSWMPYDKDQSMWFNLYLKEHTEKQICWETISWLPTVTLQRKWKKSLSCECL